MPVRRTHEPLAIASGFFRPYVPCVTAWHPLRASNPEC
ncbi:hypothetical protein BURMUCF1_3562 [Burkholderia multivorans ATCC BAA-247]|nr:hypothetical protein BURMUCF1_3562 [Burkholderia multivorans ATCC BAA-247]